MFEQPKRNRTRGALAGPGTLSSSGHFISAEYDDLPEIVQRESRGFADVNIAWLAKVLTMAGTVDTKDSEARARAIFAAAISDLIEGFRTSGLLPA